MYICFAVFLLYVSNALCKVTEAVAKGDPIDYCSIASCEYPALHVMCLFKKDAEGAACVNFQKDKGFSAAEKRGILRAHNELRSAVAIGTMEDPPPFGQRIYGAEDMMEMYWDNELETLAQRWAKQCEVTYDFCRNTEQYPTVGQLVFTKKWDPSSPLSYHLNRAFLRAETWNIKYPIDLDDAESLEEKQKIMAQLIWAKADKVGCARVVLDLDVVKNPLGNDPIPKDPKDQATGPTVRQNDETKDPDNSKPRVVTAELVVCNYNDGGQMEGTIYTEGLYCSLCFCSDDYPGLCSRADALWGLRILWIPATLHNIMFLMLLH